MEYTWGPYGRKIYPRTDGGYPILMPLELRRLYQSYVDKYGHGTWALAAVSERKRTCAVLQWGNYYQGERGWTDAHIKERLEDLDLEIQALTWIYDEEGQHKFSVKNGCQQHSKQHERKCPSIQWLDQEQRRRWKTMQNALVLLDVWRGDDRKTVRNAWLKKQNTHHPDKGGSTNKSQKINDAYAYICRENGWQA
jgi:hypothetical protein